MEECLQGFEKIKRYWDPSFKHVVAKILPGEYYVTRNDELVATVLGSCVSACIRDSELKVGGMNHFMLPLDAKNKDNKSTSAHDLTKATRYGNFAMEHLINDILKQGAKRENLEIKIFGGGAVIRDWTHNEIGCRNVRFVHDYLKEEHMRIASEDVGGDVGRKIVYNPITGKVNLKRIETEKSRQIDKEELAYMESLNKGPVEGDVELF